MIFEKSQSCIEKVFVSIFSFLTKQFSKFYCLFGNFRHVYTIRWCLVEVTEVFELVTMKDWPNYTWGNFVPKPQDILKVEMIWSWGIKSRKWLSPLSNVRGAWGHAQGP